MSSSSTNKRSHARVCWLCLSTEEDHTDVSWLQPCLCRGSSQWVHRNCLEEVVDSRQLGDSSIRVSCPQCHTDYILDIPPFGFVANILNFTDRVLYRCSLHMSTGIRIGSIYWVAITYGAFSIMQVIGYQEGLSVLEEADPLQLMLGLPAIPAVLVISRLIRWDNFLLRFWRNNCNSIPIIKYFVDPKNSSADKTHTFSEPISVTRLFCGALILPTAASFTGKVIFGGVESNLERAILGGITYLAVKGVLKLYLRQKHYWRINHRKILNYSEWKDDPKYSSQATNS